MPHYFFDTIDGGGLVRDRLGTELPNDEAARRFGLAALPEMAKDEIVEGDRRSFTVVIRDDAMMVIYIGELTLVGRWLK